MKRKMKLFVHVTYLIQFYTEWLLTIAKTVNNEYQNLGTVVSWSRNKLIKKKIYNLAELK